MLTALDTLPQIPWKYKVAYLAWRFSQMEQTECPVKHSFAGDRYIREMFIPAGTLFIGRVHTNGHVVKLVSGTVYDCQEGQKREVSAPFEFHSYPGYQAVFYAMTDVVGVTEHPNPDGLTDVAVLEARDFEEAKWLIERGAMVAEQIESAEREALEEPEKVACLA